MFFRRASVLWNCGGSQLVTRLRAPVALSIERASHITPTRAVTAFNCTRQCHTQQTEKNDINGIHRNQSKMLEYSKELKQLIDEKRFDEVAQKISQVAKAERLYPNRSTLKAFTVHASKVGDVENMTLVGNCLNTEQKALVSFSNNLANAYMHAGRSAEYLDLLEETFDRSLTQEEFTQACISFPAGGVLSLLEANPDLWQKFEEIAEKYTTKGYYVGIWAIWQIYFIHKRAESHRLWQKHFHPDRHLRFHHILEAAVQVQRSPELIVDLLDVLNKSGISQKALGIVHSRLINIYCHTSEYDLTEAAVHRAAKEVGIRNVNASSLRAAKAALRSVGKTFPYEIPKDDDDTNNNRHYKKDKPFTRK